MRGRDVWRAPWWPLAVVVAGVIVPRVVLDLFTR